MNELLEKMTKTITLVNGEVAGKTSTKEMVNFPQTNSWKRKTSIRWPIVPIQKFKIS